jgi:hypothetical protein
MIINFSSLSHPRAGIHQARVVQIGNGYRQSEADAQGER